MAQAQNQELIDRFEQFYRNYYREEIGELARRYPSEQRSLAVDWQDLYRFDPDLADDYIAQPDQLREYAEEALRVYDLPVDVSLGQAHVRVRNLPELTEIREIRSRDVNTFVSVQGIVRKATDVRPKIEEAAFECQRCGTLTYIPQTGGFQEPHECQGCERQGPFTINYDQSTFVDAQKLRVQESPEGLRGGETPQSIDVNIEDDITGEVSPGDHVTVTGVLRIEQQSSGNEKSRMFDVYMDGHSLVIEDEEFENMDITDEDKQAIVELSNEDDIYDRMVDSIAPSIYGYDEIKLAIALQLFSGVTKHLPDESRIRGDFHILLIGDPGTGKCMKFDAKVTLADGSEKQIGRLVESNLDDPKPVDDGVYDEVDFDVPSLQGDGGIGFQRATKVWKREAPKRMFRIRTASGREVEVTPSHPLFVSRDAGYEPVRAEDISLGDEIAVSPDPVADGGITAEPRAQGPYSASGIGRRVVRDRIESIETVDPDYDWVYDLEVEGTHNYLANNVVSHNSQLLQYIRHIAPRSVYTSGKGSSSAGLCVTGDTVVHTGDGFRRIRDLAEQHHPEPVAADTAAEESIGVYTFDRDEGDVEVRSSSHVWRMPEKSCRRIETSHGKELEASENTPVLVCGERGIEWKPISDVGAGDYVAVPRYDDVERTTPPIEEYLEFTNEKVKLDEESLASIRRGLYDRFGTLRDAAAALGVTEDFVHSHLWNRHVPLEKLDAILDAIDATRSDVTVERAMLRHGDSVRIPDELDEDLMYLTGLVFGDGDISIPRRGGNRGTVRISNGDEDLLRRARDIIEDEFDKRVEIERQGSRVPCIRVDSATIARFFRNVGMATPKKELALHDRLTTAEHADAFLRGLMDADGSVSARTKGGSSVQFSTVSEELARQVQLMLETYGVRARVRERDRRGEYELNGGQTIETKNVQYHVELCGADIERYAGTIGFDSVEKGAALERIIGDAERREETIPVGAALAGIDESAGGYYDYMNLDRGDNPGRGRAREVLDELDLGVAEPIVEEAVEADLRWDEVVAAVDTGEKEVFDLTVPDTHNFVGNGVVTHNTAAAVRDDFGDGQQWSLEAGALVLADKGTAAVDELDKMRCVTGDTRVRMGDGRTVPIRRLALRAEEGGEIEVLDNGRTIRDIDETVLTMTEGERIVERPVTAVHEYEAPDMLYEVALESGASVTATADHPFLVSEDGKRTERSAVELTAGDRVYVPRKGPMTTTDGGISCDSNAPSGLPRADVAWSRVAHVREVSGEGRRVYDLTVEGTHNFVANGVVVHNSEDRSAMHEALEQQSYHPGSEILLADGRRVEIGEFVDERMAERPGDVIDGVDCEILPVDDVGIHSVDLETNDVEKVDVDRVSRHEAPEEFVRVSFSNGRDVLVTPEHPMFVEEGGEIGTVPAEDITEGSFVPAPRKLPNSSETVPLAGEPHVGKEMDADLPDGMSPDLAELLGFLVAEGYSYAGSVHEIGFSNQDERLLARVDGLVESVFGMESYDTTNGEGTVTKRLISTKLYRWFEGNFPGVMHTAREKRVPAKVLGASEEEIRRFLVGAFAGDGGVESESTAFSTSSRGLADDYADALAKIGVASRIHYDSAEDSWKTYVMGDSIGRFVEAVVEPADDRYERARRFAERGDRTKRHHDVLPPSAAREIRTLRRLVGLRCTGEFRPNLDEGYGVQIETVERHLEALETRIRSVREALDDAETLADVRAAIGWSGRRLAERIDGETTSAIHHAEGGGYDAERRQSLRDRALEAAIRALDEAEDRIERIESRCDLRYYRVTDAETVPNEGDYECDWVYDVTVEPTNTFVSQGVILHNSVSISKAGINATLKSRCSLLGAANPKYGRFDQYESIAEQIELDPALISRFDLIFTVTDQPDEEEDRKLAEHILRTNYAGELNTQSTELSTPNVSRDEVDEMTGEVEPAIDSELFRKYIAYAKRNCFPTMTEEAREAIRDFYVDLRSRGAEEDAPVPVTARKLEALVRLSEASARVRLSDTIEREDAERVIDIVRSCLRDIGVDPETGEFDADVIETGTSKSQRDRIKNLRSLIAEIEDEYEEGAPIDEIIDRAEEVGIDQSKAEHEIEKLRQRGEVYEPAQGHLRTT